MTHRGWRLSIAIACVAAGAAVVPALLISRPPDVRTEDRNGDGRPDVWRTYNQQSQLAAVAVDSNFDGRQDVQEYYEQGVLLRRESDRDFNDRVDLVQEYDSQTSQRVRSVEDIDFDGSADLLVLFRDGLPVYRKWATRPLAPTPGHTAAVVATAPRTAGHQLAALDDPFRSDFALSAAHRAMDSGSGIGLSTSGGLPSSGRSLAVPTPFWSRVAGAPALHVPSTLTSSSSPRGPPSSSPLA